MHRRTDLSGICQPFSQETLRQACFAESDPRSLAKGTWLGAEGNLSKSNASKVHDLYEASEPSGLHQQKMRRRITERE